MTYKEAKIAMLGEMPVVYRELSYKKISGLIYRKVPESGRICIRAELQGVCGHSSVIARLDQVNWIDESGRTQVSEIPARNEDGPAPQEINAKAAFLSGDEVLYDGDRHIVSAMIIRNWVDHNYWLELELTRLSDGLVQQAWSGSVVYHLQEQ